MTSENRVVTHALRRATRVLRQSVLRQRPITLPNLLRLFRRNVGLATNRDETGRAMDWLARHYQQIQCSGALRAAVPR